MTDNEIIKALERCFTNDFGKTNCNKCAFHTATAKCMDDMQNAVIDLINRQKAEIERLEKELMKCKLEKEMLYQTVEEIKSKAIKEFAERLKEIGEETLEYSSHYFTISENDINNLVKEMEGSE